MPTSDKGSESPQGTESPKSASLRFDDDEEESPFLYTRHAAPQPGNGADHENASEPLPIPDQPPAATLALVHSVETPDAPSAPAADAPAPYSEDHIASVFTKRHGADWRFVAEWNAWYRWDGFTWQRDSTLAVFDIIRGICREISTWGGELTVAQKRVISGAKTVAAGERLAKSARDTVGVIDQWNADPWLLATPGGVLDLRTAKMRPAAREDYMTQRTIVEPGGDCPIWREFLGTITAGDTALQRYLARWAGYSACGVTAEHAIAFFYGTGANGKSIFLDTIRDVLGDYGTVASMDMFLETKHERHPAELAALMGKRVVTGQETQRGRRWDESKIKEMSAAKKIKARFMAQNWFEYVPQFKLLFAGNHKPGLRSVDEAIRRRVHIVPFLVTIPADERDPYLAEKLRAEYGGILEWIVAGCLDWQAHGLTPPACVAGATEDYMEAEDALSTWIGERCDLRRHCALKALYQDWAKWADEQGEYCGSAKQFAADLEARGFTWKRTADGKQFDKIDLRFTDNAPPSHYTE